MLPAVPPGGSAQHTLPDTSTSPPGKQDLLRAVRQEQSSRGVCAAVALPSHVWSCILRHVLRCAPVDKRYLFGSDSATIRLAIRLAIVSCTFREAAVDAARDTLEFALTPRNQLAPQYLSPLVSSEQSTGAAVAPAGAHPVSAC